MMTDREVAVRCQRACACACVSQAHEDHDDAPPLEGTWAAEAADNGHGRVLFIGAGGRWSSDFPALQAKCCCSLQTAASDGQASTGMAAQVMRSVTTYASSSSNLELPVKRACCSCATRWPDLVATLLDEACAGFSL